MATEFTKQQLNVILSALDDQPRNPATKAAALKAIEATKEDGGTVYRIAG